MRLKNQHLSRLKLTFNVLQQTSLYLISIRIQNIKLLIWLIQNLTYKWAQK